MNQRWLFQRETYRPPDEVIQTRLYDVAAIAQDAEAKSFVCSHHYSGSYPAARFRYGLYRAGRLEGVAVFSVPMNYASLAPLGAPPKECVELGRFVLIDAVPGNGETWFLGRCFEQLRKSGVPGIVSYSDPYARTNAHGEQVFGGHIGTIYQAHNAVYLGRATKRWLKLLPDGTVLSDRVISKIRSGDRGWQYGVDKLVAFGAFPPPNGEDGDTLSRWADEWIPRLTRRVFHPGNHKYAWGLDRNVRRALPRSKPYPKLRPTA